MKGVEQLPGLLVTLAHMCRFDVRVAEGPQGRPSLNPTGIMTDSPEIAAELDKRCNHSSKGNHAELIGGKAKYAEKYTIEFIGAVFIRGLRRQLEADGA